MIHYIKGIISDFCENMVIIENNGIGYEINIPSSSALYMNSVGDEIKIFTYMVVRDDDISIYGFDDSESLNIFRMLINVSGIGAKAGISILSSLTVEEIKQAIVFDQPEILSKAQGVGKKTAQRVVLELADRLKKEVSYFSNNKIEYDSNKILLKERNKASEAVEALISLGYSKSEATEAVRSVSKEGLTVEDHLKAALKLLSII